MKIYNYIGPLELLSLLGNESSRIRIQNQTDVLKWVKNTNQQADSESKVIVTFIIDTRGALWIADRHSEHVVCANGGPVLSAGEMTFRVTPNELEVSAVTNQSTGFCTEPESWMSVANALNKIGFAHSDSFTTEFNFRQCGQCGSINLVKENWFVCGVCDAELSEVWNLASS